MLFLLLYAIGITVAWRRAANNAYPSAVQRPQALWTPITGARVPKNPAFLPNAVRKYRLGVSQGFDFYNKDAGIPISYGTPVVAVADGVLERVDDAYSELDSEVWKALLAEVEANGATPSQLDRFRGRQIWLRISESETSSSRAAGWVVRYAHLAGIAPNVQVGSRVYQGQVLGYVGNSGTSTGVAGNTDGSRLHFELWRNEQEFWGKGLNSEEVRQRAQQLFVQP